MRVVAAIIVGTCITIEAGCSSTPQANISNLATAQPEKVDKKKKDKEKDESLLANTDSSTCDKRLWDHVYNPVRLEVQKDCMSVTGTITERDADDDGDEHMLLRLDGGQDDLLTKRNKKKKDGALVIEAVCANPPKLKKVGNACDNFSNSVQLPQVGDHVLVTGSYVLDGHNGWAEIHPITRVARQ